MLSSITRFLRDEEGATAIEYALIAGLIAVTLVAVLTGVGTTLIAKFNSIITSLGGTAVS